MAANLSCCLCRLRGLAGVPRRAPGWQDAHRVAPGGRGSAAERRSAGLCALPGAGAQRLRRPALNPDLHEAPRSGGASCRNPDLHEAPPRARTPRPQLAGSTRALLPQRPPPSRARRLIQVAHPGQSASRTPAAAALGAPPGGGPPHNRLAFRRGCLNRLGCAGPVRAGVPVADLDAAVVRVETGPPTRAPGGQPVCLSRL